MSITENHVFFASRKKMRWKKC